MAKRERKTSVGMDDDAAAAADHAKRVKEEDERYRWDTPSGDGVNNAAEVVNISIPFAAEAAAYFSSSATGLFSIGSSSPAPAAGSSHVAGGNGSRDHKGFWCHNCRRMYSSKFAVKKHHESVHLGMKPFPCHLCWYRAAQAVNLKRHLLSKHDVDLDIKGIFPTQPTVEKQHVLQLLHCNFCIFEVGVQDLLDAHTAHRHPVEAAAEVGNRLATEAAVASVEVWSGDNTLAEQELPQVVSEEVVFDAPSLNYVEDPATMDPNVDPIAYLGLDPSAYTCESCDFRSLSTPDMDRHRTLWHSLELDLQDLNLNPSLEFDFDLTYDCGICGYHAEGAEALHAHQVEVHGNFLQL